MRGYPRTWLTERPADEVVITKTTRSRGYTISYDDAGSGPVIVLVPGGTMSAGDWLDAGYVDQLAGSHGVISVAPLGLGQSDKPHDEAAYRLPDVAADVIAVMDAATVDRAVVWGYSYGGEVAAAVASHHVAFNDPRAIGAMWSGADRSGSTTDLTRISAPALVLGGHTGEAEPAPDE